MKMHTFLAVGTTVGLVLLSGVSAAQGERNQLRPGPSLEGAWKVEVTLRDDALDCTNAPLNTFPPNPFPSFVTFHEGGTLNEMGTRSPPANRGTGFGVWERKGARKYSSRTLFHSFENGTLIAVFDFSSDITLTKQGDTFTTISRLVRTDLSGNELHFCATLFGERITL